jgi:hypothetical protein
MSGQRRHFGTDQKAAILNPLSSSSKPPKLFSGSIVGVSLDDLWSPDGLSNIEVNTTEAEARLKSGFADCGTECLGWYQPYHVYDEWHWGVYLNSARIIDWGCVLRARLFRTGCPQPNAAYTIAVRLILAHEFFHARMETYALGQELFGRRPVFRPYSRAVYRPTFGTSQALEEATANFVARQEIRDLVSSWVDAGSWNQKGVAEVMDFIHMMYELSPPGYRDWHIAGDSRTWRRLAAQTLTGLLELSWFSVKWKRQLAG